MPDAHQPPPVPRGTGPQSQAKAKALELAEAQASDEDIEAAIRHEYRGRLPPSEIRDAMAAWRRAGLLDDARAAGRLSAQEALLHVAKTGEGGARTQAAGRILDREEHLKGLGDLVERWRRRLMTASPTELQAVLKELTDELGKA